MIFGKNYDVLLLSSRESGLRTVPMQNRLWNFGIEANVYC